MIRPQISIVNLPSNYKKTFNIYTGLLKWIGIDIFGPNLDRTNVNSCVRLFIFNIIFIPFVGFQLSLIFQIKAESFLEGAAVFPIILIGILNIIKMMTALTHRNEIKGVFMDIGLLWPKQLGNDEKGWLMKTWLRRMGVLVKSFFIYAVVNLVIFEVVPLLMSCFSNEYMLPFQPPVVVNSTMVFLTTYAWEMGATIPCQVCLYIPYDLLIMTITSNVSILLRLLQVDLESAIKARHGPVMMNDFENYAEIIGIVKVHQKILSIVTQLNKIFGLVIFIHIAFSSILICFFGFLTVVYGGVAEIIANLLSVLNAMVLMFLLALSGQLLCDTSSGVADAAYNSLWYEADLKVKRLILFIIIRSQKSCNLSALGYSNMTLGSFTKIMSSAWTYFTLLVQVYEEN